MIVENFIDCFWSVGIGLVPLIVPVIGMILVFKIIKDMLK